jgi:hypothetical protein
MPESELLTPKECAQYRRCSIRKLDRERAERRGCPYVRIDGRIFYRRSDVDLFIGAHICGESARHTAEYCFVTIPTQNSFRAQPALRRKLHCPAAVGVRTKRRCRRRWHEHHRHRRGPRRSSARRPRVARCVAAYVAETGGARAISSFTTSAE